MTLSLVPAKFKVKDNPAEEEEKKEKLEVPKEYYLGELQKWLVREIENNPNVSRGTKDHVWARYFQEKELLVTETIKENYIREFDCWITGRSRYNDPRYTWWGRKRLIGPSIDEYLTQFVEKKSEFHLFMAKLRKRIPNNIVEAWLYFRLVILPGPNGVRLDQFNKYIENNYLKDWVHWFNHGYITDARVRESTAEVEDLRPGIIPGPECDPDTMRTLTGVDPTTGGDPTATIVRDRGGTDTAPPDVPVIVQGRVEPTTVPATTATVPPPAPAPVPAPTPPPVTTPPTPATTTENILSDQNRLLERILNVLSTPPPPPPTPGVVNENDVVNRLMNQLTPEFNKLTEALKATSSQKETQAAQPSAPIPVKTPPNPGPDDVVRTLQQQSSILEDIRNTMRTRSDLTLQQLQELNTTIQQIRRQPVLTTDDVANAVTSAVSLIDVSDDVRDAVNGAGLTNKLEMIEKKVNTDLVNLSSMVSTNSVETKRRFDALDAFITKVSPTPTAIQQSNIQEIADIVTKSVMAQIPALDANQKLIMDKLSLMQKTIGPLTTAFANNIAKVTEKVTGLTTTLDQVRQGVGTIRDQVIQEVREQATGIETKIGQTKEEQTKEAFQVALELDRRSNERSALMLQSANQYVQAVTNAQNQFLQTGIQSEFRNVSGQIGVIAGRQDILAGGLQAVGTTVANQQQLISNVAEVAAKTQTGDIDRLKKEVEDLEGKLERERTRTRDEGELAWTNVKLETRINALTTELSEIQKQKVRADESAEETEKFNKKMEDLNRTLEKLKETVASRQEPQITLPMPNMPSMNNTPVIPEVVPRIIPINASSNIDELNGANINEPFSLTNRATEVLQAEHGMNPMQLAVVNKAVKRLAEDAEEAVIVKNNMKEQLLLTDRPHEEVEEEERPVARRRRKITEAAVSPTNITRNFERFKEAASTVASVSSNAATQIGSMAFEAGANALLSTGAALLNVASVGISAIVPYRAPTRKRTSGGFRLDEPIDPPEEIAREFSENHSNQIVEYRSAIQRSFDHVKRINGHLNNVMKSSMRIFGNDFKVIGALETTKRLVEEGLEQLSNNCATTKQNDQDLLIQARALASLVGETFEFIESSTGRELPGKLRATQTLVNEEFDKLQRAQGDIFFSREELEGEGRKIVEYMNNLKSEIKEEIWPLSRMLNISVGQMEAILNSINFNGTVALKGLLIQLKAQEQKAISARQNLLSEFKEELEAPKISDTVGRIDLELDKMILSSDRVALDYFQTRKLVNDKAPDAVENTVRECATIRYLQNQLFRFKETARSPQTRNVAERIHNKLDILARTLEFHTNDDFYRGIRSLNLENINVMKNMGHVIIDDPIPEPAIQTALKAHQLLQSFEVDKKYYLQAIRSTAQSESDKSLKIPVFSAQNFLRKNPATQVAWSASTSSGATMGNMRVTEQDLLSPLVVPQPLEKDLRGQLFSSAKVGEDLLPTRTSTPVAGEPGLIRRLWAGATQRTPQDRGEIALAKAYEKEKKITESLQRVEERVKHVEAAQRVEELRPPLMLISEKELEQPPPIRVKTPTPAPPPPPALPQELSSIEKVLNNRRYIILESDPSTEEMARVKEEYPIPFAMSELSYHRDASRQPLRSIAEMVEQYYTSDIKIGKEAIVKQLTNLSTAIKQSEQTIPDSFVESFLRTLRKDRVTDPVFRDIMVRAKRNINTGLDRLNRRFSKPEGVKQKTERKRSRIAEVTSSSSSSTAGHVIQTTGGGRAQKTTA